MENDDAMHHNAVNHELIDVFKQTYLAIGLSEAEVAEIAHIAIVDKHLAGETLTRQGERSSDLLVILEGKVNVMTQGGEKLAEVGPGSILGEVSLVDDMPRSADAVCIGLVRVARFPSREFRSLLNHHRNMGFIVLANLGRVLASRLRATSERVDHLAGQDIWKHAL